MHNQYLIKQTLILKAQARDFRWFVTTIRRRAHSPDLTKLARSLFAKQGLVSTNHCTTVIIGTEWQKKVFTAFKL